MIHREKSADGADVFHAYALRNEGLGYEMVRVGTYATSEAAKDAVAPDLEKQIEAFTAEIKTFQLALAHEGWEALSYDEFQIELLRSQASKLHEIGYFISEHAASLFRSPSSGDHHSGVVTLWGPAAVEYARRHGHTVRYGRYGKNGGSEFEEEVTAGRAFEVLPLIDVHTYLAISIPRDLVPSDLPPSVSPFDLRSVAASTSPARLRERAAQSRLLAEQFAARMRAEATEFERLADAAGAHQ